MHSISVLQGEYFRRPWRWWLIFASIGVGLIMLALFGGRWVQGADMPTIRNADYGNGIILLALYAGYLFRLFRHEQLPTTLTLTDEGIMKGNRLVEWNKLQGFVLEAEMETGLLKNIVFVYNRGHSIHTIVSDELSSIGLFVEEMEQNIPLLDSFTQTFIEKLMRKCRL